MKKSVVLVDKAATWLWKDWFVYLKMKIPGGKEPGGGEVSFKEHCCGNEEEQYMILGISGIA